MRNLRCQSVCPCTTSIYPICQNSIVNRQIASREQNRVNSVMSMLANVLVKLRLLRYTVGCAVWPTSMDPKQSCSKRLILYCT
jgi:hypothetical protein